MVKIKICGLKSLEDVHIVNRYKPDYIGFVFAQSKRFIPANLASKLKDDLNKEIQAAGVFVNEPVEHVISLCKEGIIDVVQLHGEEDEVYIHTLKNQISNTIIKAVRVKSREQIVKMQRFPCDYLLLDTFIKDQYGGSGLTFDRSLIPENCKPFFLAGGLKKDNVREAINDCSPYCIDISSGAETGGKKDETKIKDIIELVRGSNRIT